MEQPKTRAAISYRYSVQAGDKEQVAQVVQSTGFFTEEECAIAVELVEIALKHPSSDEYRFIFAESGGVVAGYSCYGRIPLTQSSYDMYWLAVRNTSRRSGIGRQLLKRTEQEIVNEGGTRVYLDTSGRALYDPTRKFYEAHGYRVDAVLQDFYAAGDPKVIYVKQFEGSSVLTA